jgi:deazaflavin-dependent oxidoreductase (nitroreductase family)
MIFPDGSSIVANLTTVGRKSGQPRTVELRLICYQGCFYATSSRIAGKHWCQNMLKNPTCEISLNGQRASCMAKRVTDDSLRRTILVFRDSAPQMERVVFEIRPRS